MNFQDWEFHQSKLPKEVFQREQRITEIEEQFRQDIKNNPAAMQYLNCFDPGSVDHFINQYAKAKANVIRYSEQYIRDIEEVRELRYREETEYAFDMILQKKLFNTQLLWRAEQMNIPEIRIGHDFMQWEHAVRICPFLEPVTQQEVEVMKLYLKTEHCDIADKNISNWQNYNQLMERDEDGSFVAMPDWYEFYDGLMGTGALLELPNNRGIAEGHYHGLGSKAIFDENMAKRAAGQGPAPVEERPEPIFCGYHERYQFAVHFDDPYFAAFFKRDIENYEEKQENEADDYEPDIYMIELEKISNPPPVRGGLSWRAALRQCYMDYIHSVIAEDIDLAWEEYTFMKETGLSPNVDTSSFDIYKKMSDGVIEMIYKGRELSGEPRDLNF